MIEQIEWLGHASFRIQGSPVFYIDPWKIVRDSLRAEVILISHDHYDHCSPGDVDKLREADTQVIVSAASAALIPNAVVLRPWQIMTFGRTCLKAIPAYNETHPQTREGLGFLISIGFYDIYYAGDTGLIPEMDMLKPDIAILPISGKHTMSIADAVQAVQRMRPRWVIPSHWGVAGEGASVADARDFAAALKGTAEVILPEQG